VKLAIPITAGIVMAVLVMAVGSRLYMGAELRAATQAMAKLNADTARAHAKKQAQRDAELVGQRAQADALVQAQLQDNAAKPQAQAQAQAQANLTAQKAPIRKN